MMTTTIGSTSSVPSTGWPQTSQTGSSRVLTPLLSASQACRSGDTSTPWSVHQALPVTDRLREHRVVDSGDGCGL
jgi:hypothetical protein